MNSETTFDADKCGYNTDKIGLLCKENQTIESRSERIPRSGSTELAEVLLRG
jgi:hypothetical protein